MTIGSAPAEPSGPATPYLDAAMVGFSRARVANAAALGAASRLIEDVVAREGIVHVFGSGHSQLVALEVNRRAGGLAPLQVIFDPGWGAAELVEGYGRTLLADIDLQPLDCLIAISNSGTTAASIEIADAARASGMPVIAVVSTAASCSAPARHSSGRKLIDLADVVLDTGAPCGDASVRLPGLAVGLGPTSTIVAAALLHETIVGAVARLVSRGVTPPLVRSNAETGGHEHNRRLRDRYRARLRLVP